jgi:hypothetical protein
MMSVHTGGAEVIGTPSEGRILTDAVEKVENRLADYEDNFSLSLKPIRLAKSEH